MKRRLCSILLAFALCLSLLPAGALAAEADAQTDGTAGYTVQYNANGGTGAPADSTTYQSDGQFTIPDAIPTYENYAFHGWARKDNTDTLYWPGDTVSIDSSNSVTTMKAQWGEQNVSITTNGAVAYYTCLADAFQLAADGATITVEKDYADSGIVMLYDEGAPALSRWI